MPWSGLGADRLPVQGRRMNEKGGRMAPFSFCEKFFCGSGVTSPCFGKEQPHPDSADETHRIIFPFCYAIQKNVALASDDKLEVRGQGDALVKKVVKPA